MQRRDEDGGQLSNEAVRGVCAGGLKCLKLMLFHGSNLVQ